MSAPDPVVQLVQTVNPIVRPVESLRKEAAGTLSINNRNWALVSHQKRSESGVAGVVFLETADREEALIVKEHMSNYKSQLVSMFLKSAGFEVPDSVLISKQSKEGQEMLNAFNSAAKPKSGKPAQMDHKKNIKHYLVMDRVQGQEASQVRSKLSKKDKEEIGRIYVYDMLFNNIDRINIRNGLFNSGNIMYDEKNKHISLIDNDSLPIVPKFIDEKKSEFAALVSEIDGGDRARAKRIGSMVMNSQADAETFFTGMKKAIDELRAKGADGLRESLEKEKQKIIKETALESDSEKQLDSVRDYVVELSTVLKVPTK